MDQIESALKVAAKALVKFKHEQDLMDVQNIQLNAMCHLLQGTEMERVIWRQIQSKAVARGLHREGSW